MWVIRTQAQIDAIESEPALVGVFVDRSYDREKIQWIIDARNGFNSHARDAWHLLVPMNDGYGIDAFMGPEQYGVELASAIIDRLEIGFSDLPCIVFRAKDENYFFLKLGKKSRDQFYEEIGLIADIARACQDECKEEGKRFRDHVNKRVAAHLRNRKLLSATRSALPALSGLLGAVVDVGELV